MRQLHIGILDVVDIPSHGLWSRMMNANFASIMPQVLAAWCERAGHLVHYACFTGFGDPLAELPADDLDLLFVGAFTQAAHFAYAVSNLYRQRGVVTVLGGPHARCYPEDAARFFDYVLGFTDRAVVAEVLSECAPHRPLGRRLSAATQPVELVPLAERWKFLEQALRKAPTIKIVPMIGSLGCPYTCSFCIDSTVDYQPLSFAQLGEDLRFLLGKLKNPIVGWHDPNFGVRFEQYMETIEGAVPPGRMRHIAESSLSLLSEQHLVRLKRNGFGGILPGIESWFDLGNKSKTRLVGMDKVRQVSEQVNTILRYVPFVRTNFVFGLDMDHGPEPFELTKRFQDLTPGAFPSYSLLSAFGRAAPLNLEYQRAGRVLPFPFQFLDNHQAMNVRPKNYAWPEFYDHVVDITRYSFSPRRLARRFRHTQGIPRWLHLVSSVSTEGFGRLRYHSMIRRLLDTDPMVRGFMEGESDVLPEFYRARIRRQLGPIYGLLPEGALTHDHVAYLKSAGAPATETAPAAVQIQPRPHRTHAPAPVPTREDEARQELQM
jgi:hypothetical protein